LDCSKKHSSHISGIRRSERYHRKKRHIQNIRAMQEDFRHWVIEIRPLKKSMKMKQKKYPWWYD
jgi:hypothetical protein